MTAANFEASTASDLLTASTRAMAALSGAVDDLHRAALILRQLASGTSQRLRGPEDYRRIAGQLAERAMACKAAEEALVAACRTALGLPPA